MISTTDLTSYTTYALDVQQAIDEEGRSLIELYADRTVKVETEILVLAIKYLAADAYYSKVKFVFAIILTGSHIIGNCE
ncbi:hypothetical protein [Microbulbifer sp. SSSA005]|uniref:hypothetical protein n=1 Tax=Microbulbifer sp. SSSA005 TaxID=3243378 RepID=UPI0040399E45